MTTRRTILAGIAATVALSGASYAEDWHAKYPELVFAVVPPRTPRAWSTAGRLSSPIFRRSSAPR